ncbi:MAG: chromosomal replication initiator protein DnaA [Rhodobiaceae bacterium]|nr:chromosomal replication initiator protein DnaA [Rhodobiaceae bacterium]MCC0042465.1 chromosomal replication initiator protein DnaA [Rhodobiaceae bacterium]
MDVARSAAAGGGTGAEFRKGWDRILQRLVAEFGQNVFQSWFARLKFDGVEGDVAVLSVPTPFLRSWIRDNYMTRIAAMWREEFDHVAGIDLRLRLPGQKNGVEKAEPAEEPAARPAARSTAALAEAAAAVGNGEGIPLDGRLTFDSFVSAPTNTLAHAAAIEIAGATTNGAPRYNPLYIHGGVGRGKTHLLHAIAWDVRRRAPERKVRVLSSDLFMLKFVSAARDNDTVSFKNMLRTSDLLLIDDLQFLQGKGTHKEFGYTINALVESGKQIVVVADRPAARLEGFDERIKSRLAGGLALEIGAPDAVLRRAILERRLESMHKDAANLHLDADVISFIARNLSSNGRDIEGALNRLVHHAAHSGERITVEQAEALMRDLIVARESRPVKIEWIQKIVSQVYKVSRQDLVSERRTQAVVRPRQIAMYLCKTMTPRSLPDIGKRFGNRDHTTVLHAIRKIEGLISKDDLLRREIETLRRRIEDEADRDE